jgi:CheY-like chemotaxis protein
MAKSQWAAGGAWHVRSGWSGRGFTPVPLSGKNMSVEQDPTRDGLRILLVEDDPDHAELVRRGLEEYGSRLRLTHLADGEVALTYLRERAPRDSPDRPHLILLDLRLPKVDGLEVLREIKGAPDLCDIPCVVLTTSRAEGDMVKAYRLHANSYLVKPGEYDRFVQLIADVERYWLQQNTQPAPGGPS